MYRTAVALLMILALSACKTTVEQRPDSLKTVVLPTQPISSITLTYSPSGSADLKDNAGFDQNELIKSVTQRLSAKQVFASNASSGNVLEIQITAVRYRSTFNAIMWGAMSGSDNVRGEVYLRDASGKLMSHFEVYAMYALGGLVGGQKDVRWPYLYNKFADAVTEHLTQSAILKRQSVRGAVRLRSEGRIV
jgi:hypothetical protein